MGRFRRDLYQRVAGVVIELPPLTARLEDIVPLSVHFAALRGQLLDSAAEQVLLNYSWPGNVRELRLAIERAGELVENGVLPAAAVAEGIALGAPSGKASGAITARRSSNLRPIEQRDVEQISRLCESVSWNIEKAARELGISRASMYRRLRTLGIRPRSVSVSRHVR